MADNWTSHGTPTKKKHDEISANVLPIMLCYSRQHHRP